MNLKQLIASLDSDSERNDTLRFLDSLVVNVDGALVRSLAVIVGKPSSIENTNQFASLLVALKSEAFISPLIDAISRGTPKTSPWLADYMYALGALVSECDDYREVEEDFVHLLGGWLLSTGGGEISWKAGTVLAEVEHPSSRQYLLRGAADQSLFHQTRISCIRAIVNQYPEDAPALLEQLASDPQRHVRDAVTKQQRWVRLRSLEPDSPGSR